MWKNVAQPDSPQMIWHMRNTCWIPKAKNTHLEYVKLLLIYGNRVTCVHLNVTLYVYWLSCYSSTKVWETWQQALHARMTIVHILSLHTDVFQQWCSYWLIFLRIGIQSWYAHLNLILWKKVVSWEGWDIWLAHFTTRLCSLPTVIEVGMLAASVYWFSVAEGWSGIASFSKDINETLLMIWQLSKNTYWRYFGDY